MKQHLVQITCDVCHTIVEETSTHVISLDKSTWQVDTCEKCELDMTVYFAAVGETAIKVKAPRAKAVKAGDKVVTVENSIKCPGCDVVAKNERGLSMHQARSTKEQCSEGRKA